MNKRKKEIWQFEEEGHSFVIRLWYERGDGRNQVRAEWRGWIDHVHSGRRYYFRDIDDIGHFILIFLNPPFTKPAFSSRDGEH